MANTCLELLEEWNIPIWSSGFWGFRFAGITTGLLQDFLLEGAATGLGATWTVPFRPGSYLYDQPADAIALLGQDCLRPVYPDEDPWLSARPRIQDKWNFWTGSPKAGMIEDLTAAGVVATVQVPGDFAGPIPVGYAESEADYWSRFWVEVAQPNPLTGPGLPWGGFNWGPNNYGPTGGTIEYFNLIRSIVGRLKPVQWIVWQYRFETVSGDTVVLQGTNRPLDPDYDYLQ